MTAMCPQLSKRLALLLCLSTASCGGPQVPFEPVPVRVEVVQPRRSPVLPNVDVALDQLAAQIVGALDAQQKSAIAVIGFSDESGGESSFGCFLAEELTTRLFLAKRFTVIERTLLQRILQEQRIERGTSLIDPASAKQVGKLLGVDALASGTYTDLGERVRINGRLIATETGKVFAAAGVGLAMDPWVRGLLSKPIVRPPLPPVAPPRIVASRSRTPVERVQKEPAQVSASLLQNGDFTAGLDVGWHKEITWDDPQLAGINWVKQQDGNLHLFHGNGASFITLTQTVPVPNASVTLRVHARYGAGGYVNTMSRSLVIFEYLTATGRVLGSNRVGAYAAWEEQLFPPDSPLNRTLQKWSFTNSWGTTEFQQTVIDLPEELSTYLIGVPPGLIKAVRVTVVCGGVRAGSGELGNAEMWIKQIDIVKK